MSGWVKWTKAPGADPLSGCVSINQTGMQIAADVVEHYLKNPRIELYWNEDEELVGIKSSDDGYKPRINKSGSMSLQTKAFQRKYGIKNGKYPLTYQKDLDMVTFEPERW